MIHRIRAPRLMPDIPTLLRSTRIADVYYSGDVSCARLAERWGSSGTWSDNAPAHLSWRYDFQPVHCWFIFRISLYILLSVHKRRPRSSIRLQAEWYEEVLEYHASSEMPSSGGSAMQSNRPCKTHTKMKEKQQPRNWTCSPRSKETSCAESSSCTIRRVMEISW